MVKMVKTMTPFIAVVAFLCLCIKGENLNECVKPHSKCCFHQGTGLDFNLCPLILSNESQIPYYDISDTVYNDDNISYRLTFNIGAPVLQYPSNICATHRGQFCHGDDSRHFCEQPPDLRNQTFPAKAWSYIEEIDERTGETIECWNLASPNGDLYAYSATSYFSPMQGDMNWAAGIQLHYNAGDYDEKVMRNRWINLLFVCKNTYKNGDGIIKASPVFRSKLWAEYALYFESIYGCPTTCVSGSQLCSSNGVCGYDFTLNIARCYCFEGFIGDFCEENDDQYILTPPDMHNNDNNENDEYIYKIPTDFVSSLGIPLNVTFDLNPMINEIGKYIKMENLNDPDTEFYLNVVGKMSDRKTMNMSRNAYTKCYQLDNGNGYGFLYNIMQKTCHLLGRHIEYGIIDETNPAKGWYLKWTNDDLDDSDECGHEGRSFMIPIYCPDTDKTIPNPPPIFPYPIQQIDYVGCKWKSHQILPFGCPTECIKTSKSSKHLTIYTICSLHGVCALDPYKEGTTCLCDTGYEGNDCSIQSTDSPTPTPTSIPTQSPVDNKSNNNSFITLNKQMFLMVIGGIGLSFLLLIIGLIVFCKCYCDLHKKLDYDYNRISDNDSNSGGSSMDGVDVKKEDETDNQYQLIDTHDVNNTLNSDE